VDTFEAASRSSRIKSFNVLLLAVLIVGTFLPACQGTSSNIQQQSMMAQTLQKSSLKQLDRSGQSTGNFQDGYVKVSYRYTPGEDGLRISGSVWFGDAIVMNYLFVGTFHMDILLADAQGQVVSQQSLATALNMNVADSIEFMTTVSLPPQANYMAFSYTGRVHGLGESPMAIWYYPVVR
jgi:hypothetical protein